MNKLWLVIQREYWTRVKRRSFILTTILTPLGIAVFFVVIGFIFAYEGDERRTIFVIDEENVLDGALKDDETMIFQFKDMPVDAAKQAVRDGKADGALVVPGLRDIMARDLTVYYYSDDQLNITASENIRSRLRSRIRSYKIEQLQMDEKELEVLDVDISLDPEPLDEEGKDASTITGFIAAGIGGVAGFLMYLLVFINGVMVMRSVMEEKINRIVEVMISSVRPFQLMLGKIIGVGAVGLTQLFIWMVLIPIVFLVVNLFFGFDPNQMAEMQQATPGAGVNPEEMQSKVVLAMQEIRNMNWSLIIPMFLFYFLLGYILYSSLFAAVGSAVGDDLNESQSLTLPITIPILLAFYIMFVTVQSPDSSLAVFSSIFPLFSPLVMPARLAFDPPVWQLILSALLLILNVILFVWIAGRIYRVGILMYGKKASFRELGKWIFRS